MPKLQPAHEEYMPNEHSPLRLYEYTAADIEEHAVVPADADQATTRVDARSASEVLNSSGRPTRRTETDGDELEESPRKRRRVTVAADGQDGVAMELTIEYAPRPRLSSPPSPAIASPAHTLASTGDTTWSIHALDTEIPADDGSEEQRDEEWEDVMMLDNRVGEAGAMLTDLPTPRPGGIDPYTNTTPEARIREAEDAAETLTDPEMASQDCETVSPSTSAAHAQSTGTDGRRTNHDATNPHVTTEGTASTQLNTVNTPRPHSPDEVPAHASFPVENVGKLGRLVRVGSFWS